MSHTLALSKISSIYIFYELLSVYLKQGSTDRGSGRNLYRGIQGSTDRRFGSNFQGHEGIHGPSIWSKLLKGNAEINRPPIWYDFLRGMEGSTVDLAKREHLPRNCKIFYWQNHRGTNIWPAFLCKKNRWGYVAKGRITLGRSWLIQDCVKLII